MADPTPVLRLAGSDDADAVRAVVTAAYQPWIPVIGMRPVPLDADYDALLAARLVTVLTPPGEAEVAGLIVLVPEPSVLLIENVAVDPRHQGRGFGRILLAHAEAVARGSSLPSLRLYTHRLMATNIALYARLGYTVTTLATQEGRPVVHMAKTL